MIPILITLIYTLALGIAGREISAATPSITARPPWIDPLSWAVAVCETGKGNRYPDFEHRWPTAPRGKYGGAWGWFVGTWQLDRPHGVPRFPWNATPRQQYRVFRISMRRHRYFGCHANGGYRTWLTT